MPTSAERRSQLNSHQTAARPTVARFGPDGAGGEQVHVATVLGEGYAEWRPTGTVGELLRR